MATYEQCEQALKAGLKTRKETIAFSHRYKGDHTSNTSWKTDEEFVEHNIADILDHSYKRNDLDRLGMLLGIPTNAEQERLSRITQGVFRAGEEFDAHIVVVGIINAAQKSVCIIDSYIDEKLLTLLTGKGAAVTVSILTHRTNDATKLAAEKFNRQYSGLTIRTDRGFHDRYIIIDDHDFYHSGHSLKEVGKTTSMITKMTVESEIDKVKSQLAMLWNTAQVVV